MITIKGQKVTFAPTQIIILGFLLLILLGTLLLDLPISSNDGHSIGIVNALFTSTSAVCVTGLVVVDTATHWTTFGQVVILLLIQVGGLGFMTMATLLSLLIGRRIGLRERLIIQESLNQNSFQGMVKLIIQIIKITIFVEFLGMLLLAIQFIPQFGFRNGSYISIFHSISAFNNAGFDLMGNYSGKFSSLTSYVENPLVSITISTLVIIGGIGFFVYKDIITTKRIKSLSLHTKIVLLSTIFLLIFGTLFFFLVEYNNYSTLGNLSVGNKIIASFFQSVSTRSSGFSTVSISDLTTASKFMMIILMFIGGAPGSTAGGIKVTTIAVLFLAVLSTIHGKEDIIIFWKKLQHSVIYKSLSIIIISFMIITGVTMVLTFLENTDFMNILFETFSAFGIAGLSQGITPSLTTISKIIISITMFVGRLGPITIALALSANSQNKKSLIDYPEDRIIVG